MKALIAVLCTRIAFNSCPALAEGSGLSASLTLTSDYRFRGLSQDAGQITPQAELDWNGPYGWSMGGFASKVDFRDHENTSLELDVFAGKEFDLGWGELGLNAYYYAYPNHHPGAGSPHYSTFETSAKLSRTWRTLVATAAVSWSPNFLANGQSWDLEFGVSHELNPWLTLAGHFGRQWESRWDPVRGSGFPYAYGDIGVTARYREWSFDLRYVATSLARQQCLSAVGGRDWCEGGLILAATYLIPGAVGI